MNELDALEALAPFSRKREIVFMIIKAAIIFPLLDCLPSDIFLVQLAFAVAAGLVLNCMLESAFFYRLAICDESEVLSKISEMKLSPEIENELMKWYFPYLSDGYFNASLRQVEEYSREKRQIVKCISNPGCKVPKKYSVITEIFRKEAICGENYSGFSEADKSKIGSIFLSAFFKLRFIKAYSFEGKIAEKIAETNFLKYLLSSFPEIKVNIFQGGEKNVQDN